ncbi:helical backbone metal receptor [Bdellovibrionota bacterium FG-2]
MFNRAFLRVFVFFLFVLFASSPPLAFAREVLDAVGMRVKLQEKPLRIVTLAPSLGELVSVFLGEDFTRLVGVSEYSDVPLALNKIVSVGPYNRFNLERVVSLKPDLVLATKDGNLPDQIQHLREMGLPVVVVNTDDFSEIGNSIRLVASSMGNPVEGEQVALQFLDSLKRFSEAVKKRRATQVKRKVLLQLGDDPLVVVGAKIFLHHAIELVNAENIYGDAKDRYPRPSKEDVVRRNPDVILVLALGGGTAQFEAMVRKWGILGGLNAVKNGRVKVLHADALLRPTLRFLEGVSLLERAVYEEK